MKITPLFQIVTAIAFIYGNVIFYKLRGLARDAGYPVTMWNVPDPWQSINKMIQNEKSKEVKTKLTTMKLKVYVSIVVTVLSFIGLILTTVLE